MKKKYFTEEERKEASRIRNKRWRDANPDKVKQQYSKWKADNPEKLAAYRQTRRKTDQGYIDRFLERAKVETPDTDLDREFFEDKMQTCCFSNKPFNYDNQYTGVHNPLAPSIDRIDSTRGYYKDNVQVMLACLNKMKGEMTMDEFETLWEALTEDSK